MTTRRVLLVPVVLFAALAVAPWSVGGAVLAQEEIFQRGNQLYQDGAWTEAIEAYENVRAAGFVSADLHYNLGNAYFKSGELGRAILEWERALVLAPGDPDVTANLELARTLTTDAVEPLPRFWLFDVVAWWVDLLPRGTLVVVVALAWLASGAGVIALLLARRDAVRVAGRWIAIGSGIAVVLFGTNLLVRELGLGRADRAVVMAEAVPVRSAPAEDDDLTLFRVHEGTTVRVDQRAGGWAEVVLDDGKVGWVPERVIETI